MKTNILLDKYISLIAAKSFAEDELEKLGYRNNNYNISIEPDHFNYFSLKISLNGESVSLPITTAVNIARYILDWSEGLEGTHDIIKEIIKKEQQLKKK